MKKIIISRELTECAVFAIKQNFDYFEFVSLVRSNLEFIKERYSIYKLICVYAQVKKAFENFMILMIGTSLIPTIAKQVVKQKSKDKNTMVDMTTLFFALAIATAAAKSGIEAIKQIKK